MCNINNLSRLWTIERASFYRQLAGETPENLELMGIIDEAFMETPWYGSRQMMRHLRRQGWCVGRKRVRRLMRKIDLSPITGRRIPARRIRSTVFIPTCCGI